jgi:hypothetical protein
LSTDTGIDGRITLSPLFRRSLPLPRKTSSPSPTPSRHPSQTYQSGVFADTVPLTVFRAVDTWLSAPTSRTSIRRTFNCSTRRSGYQTVHDNRAVDVENVACVEALKRPRGVCARAASITSSPAPPVSVVAGTAISSLSFQCRIQDVVARIAPVMSLSHHLSDISISRACEMTRADVATVPSDRTSNNPSVNRSASMDCKLSGNCWSRSRKSRRSHMKKLESDLRPVKAHEKRTLSPTTCHGRR